MLSFKNVNFIYEPGRGLLHLRRVSGLSEPGAKKAVDEFCREQCVIAPNSLMTGNGALIKK